MLQTVSSEVHRLDYKAGDAKEARETVLLLTSRDSKSTVEAYLNVSTIDTDIAKH